MDNKEIAFEFERAMENMCRFPEKTCYGHSMRTLYKKKAGFESKEHKKTMIQTEM